MKKLKKIVALVMTVAMLAGLFVFAGPAAGAAAGSNSDPHPYNDVGSFNAAYVEAIQLFTKMRVVEGRDGDNFSPGGFLTRAEAAMIMTRTLITREATTALGGSSNPFSDVQSSHWASGAIAFVRNRGIISGVGNNRFAPELRLSKQAWVRILLSSLGYGQKGEYIGDGWAGRALEDALNVKVDLFGHHKGGPRGDGRLTIPYDGFNEDITREEAVALIYNAVNFVEKARFNQATGGYDIEQGSAGLGGYNTVHIAEDIGLEVERTVDRDRYGRPIDHYNDWVYRSQNIYHHPLAPHIRHADYNGNETGTVIRTALQATVAESVAGQLILAKTDVFVNGGTGGTEGIRQPDEEVYFHLRRATGNVPATHSSVIPVWEYDAIVANTTGAANASRSSIYQASYASQTSVSWSAYQMLEEYLSVIGNTVAFGPGANVQIYQDPIDDSVDVVIVTQYLNRLARKIADNTSTLLIDETSIVFDVYNGPTITPMQITEVAGARNLTNFWDLYNDASVDQRFITTPRGRITATGFAVGALIELGGIATGTIDYRQNEVYEAADAIPGTISRLAATEVTVGTSRYRLALVSPTVPAGDTVNNYTFYLDENDVVIGAEYRAAGTSTMSQYLWLVNAYGAAIVGNDDVTVIEMIANAEVHRGDMGAGKRIMALETRIGSAGQGQYRTPAGTWENLATLSSATREDVIDKTLDEIATDQFYRFASVSGNMFRLSDPTPAASFATATASYLSGGTVTMNRNSARVTNTTPNLLATDRTLLTYIGNANPVHRTGFTNFVNVDYAGGSPNPVMLVRFEPNSTTIAAEILYIDLNISGAAVAERRIGLLVGSTDEDDGTFATFRLDQNSDVVTEIDIAAGYRDEIVNRTTDYFILERDDSNEWTARNIPLGATASSVTGNKHYEIVWGYQWRVADMYGVAIYEEVNAPAPIDWVAYSGEGMGVIYMGERTFGLPGEWVGTDKSGIDSSLITSYNLIVAIREVNDGDGGVVAYVFSDLVDRYAAGLLINP